MLNNISLKNYIPKLLKRLKYINQTFYWKILNIILFQNILELIRNVLKRNNFNDRRYQYLIKNKKY